MFASCLPDRGTKCPPIPAWAKPILDDHEKRIEKLETIASDLEEIKTSIETVAKWVKSVIPLVITALVTSGLVNGKLGLFLNALVTGH